MRSTERTILIAVPLIGLLVAFWFLAISPKREEASSLSAEAVELRASIDEQKSLAASGRLARRTFADDYRRVVVMGKAVPADADTSSLLEQIEVLSGRAGIRFHSLTLEEQQAAAAPTPPPAMTTPEQPSGEAETESQPASTTATPAVATEAAAASLPLGAAVGPAGLPVMPYQLGFSGDFFEIADFLASLDGLVDEGRRGTAVHGRLLTVDGFSLVAGDGKALSAKLAVTTYVVPESQGLTAGATAAGPAPSVPPATPTSTSTESTSPAPPAVATPAVP